MNAMTPMHDEASEIASGQESPNEICLPAGALAPEDGKDAGPEPGDSVTVEITGTISRVEGDMVYMTPKSANGEPIQAPAGKPMGDEEATDAAVAAARGDEEDHPGY